MTKSKASHKQPTQHAVEATPFKGMIFALDCMPSADWKKRLAKRLVWGGTVLADGARWPPQEGGPFLILVPRNPMLRRSEVVLKNRSNPVRYWTMGSEADPHLARGSAGPARSTPSVVADHARTCGESISKGRTHVVRIEYTDHVIRLGVGSSKNLWNGYEILRAAPDSEALVPKSPLVDHGTAGKRRASDSPASSAISFHPEQSRPTSEESSSTEGQQTARREMVLSMQLDPRKRARLDLGQQATGLSTWIEITGLICIKVVTTLDMSNATLHIGDAPSEGRKVEDQPQTPSADDTDDADESSCDSDPE